MTMVQPRSNHGRIEHKPAIRGFSAPIGIQQLEKSITRNLVILMLIVTMITFSSCFNRSSMHPLLTIVVLSKGLNAKELLVVGARVETCLYHGLTTV